MGSHLRGARSHTFILGVCPSTEGEYALAAAMLVSPGEDHQVPSEINGLHPPIPLTAYQ